MSEKYKMRLCLQRMETFQYMVAMALLPVYIYIYIYKHVRCISL